MDIFFEANAVLSLFSRNFMKLKKSLPIRPSEMGVLNIIAQNPGPHTSVMLAQKLGVSKPMITAHLTALAGKGYITKEPSKDDKRVSYILLTEKALALVDSAKVDMDRQLQHLLDAMGREKFESFVRLAREANEILEEI